MCSGGYGGAGIQNWTGIVAGFVCVRTKVPTHTSNERHVTVQITTPAPRYTRIDKKFSVNQCFFRVMINGVSYKSAITTYGLACTIMVYPFPLNAL
jgi:hypothetical protein